MGQSGAGDKLTIKQSWRKFDMKMAIVKDLRFSFYTLLGCSAFLIKAPTLCHPLSHSSSALPPPVQQERSTVF
jgi:hypothetical protein